LINKIQAFLGRSALSRELSLNAMGSVLVKLGGTGLALLLTMLLARVMGAEGYGIYSYALSLVLLLTVPAQLGLPNLLVRETAKAQANEDWQIMRGLWRWSTGLAGLLSVLIAAIAWAVLIVWADSFNPEQRAALVPALLLIPFITLGNLRDSALRGLRHVVLGQLSETVLRPGLLLTVLLILGWVWQDYRFTSAQVMGVNCAAAGTAFVIVSFLLNRKTPSAFLDSPPRYHSGQWLRSALPLAFVVGMFMINQHVSVLILGYVCTPTEVGVFKVAISLSSVVIFALQTINAILAPYYARFYTQRDMQRLQRLVMLSSRAVLAFSLPVVAVLMIFGEWLLQHLFGHDYVVGYQAMVILALGQLVNAASGSVALLLNMTGHERDTAKVIALFAVLNVGLNTALIPVLGLIGAAWASAVSTTLWNLVLLWLVYRRLGVVSFAWAPSKMFFRSQSNS